MGSRRKNLLEAFQTADGGPRGQSPAPEPVRPSSAPVPPIPSSAASSLEAMASRPRSGARPPLWLIAVAGLGLVFALGYALGHGTKSETHAEQPHAPSVAPRTGLETQPRTFLGTPSNAAPATPDPSAARASDGTSDKSGRIEDSALYDPRNLQTVIVVTYSKSAKSSIDLAWATHAHLLEQNLPVFPPVASKNAIYVLVGAAPTATELEKTVAAVKALKRDGKADYATAYIARIDSIIPDRKKEK